MKKAKEQETRRVREIQDEDRLRRQQRQIIYAYGSNSYRQKKA